MSNLLLERGAQMGRHSLLPKEYQQVEYIESTGNQYIDSGVFGTHHTIINATASSTGLILNTGIMGVYNTQNTALSLFLSPYQCLICRGNNVISYPKDTFSPHQCYTIENNHIGFFSNNCSLLMWQNVCNFTTPFSIPLFTVYDLNHRPLQSLNGRIYSASIIEDCCLIRKFVPCYRKTDSEAGMFDIVGQQFYNNLGTGKFVSGPIVY